MKQLTTAIKMAVDMLIKLDKTGSWDEADDVKLKKLSEIVNVLTKLIPHGDEKEAKRNTTLERDKEIIEKFMQRQELEKTVELKKLTKATVRKKK
jgi:hypothetical protein